MGLCLGSSSDLPSPKYAHNAIWTADCVSFLRVTTHQDQHAGENPAESDSDDGARMS